MAETQPSAGASRLSGRLRELREQEFRRLTQSELGRALGGREPLKPAAVSMWETATSRRIPSPRRLEAYAQLFCTPRAFEGEAHMLALEDLSTEERERFEDLRSELLALRDSALVGEAPTQAMHPQSMWHFPDGSRVTIVGSLLPDELRPPQADRRHMNHVWSAGLADLDTLIYLFGAVRAANPRSAVVIVAAEDLIQRDVAGHLILVGGRTWKTTTRWFSRIFSLPIDSDDPGERGTILVHAPDGGTLEFGYTVIADELVEDVGVFARGENPSAPKRTLTICTGITTRGVRGAAQCFTDPEMLERNEEYLLPRFPEGSTYCIVMRVPVVNSESLPPDLSKEENRLYEWHDASTGPA